MATFHVNLTTLVVLFSVSLISLASPESLNIPNLRDFWGTATLAWFNVPRDALEREFQRRQDVDDGSFRNGVILQIPTQSKAKDTSRDQAEIMISYGRFKDFTLDRELSYELKKQITVKFKSIFVLIPFVSGENVGAVAFAKFTDSKKMLIHPFGTSSPSFVQLDRIEESENGDMTDVIIYKGDDVMVLNIQHQTEDDQQQIGELVDDFRGEIGKKRMVTDYPEPFDFMGCEIIGNASFCRILSQHRLDLQRAGSDVCTEAITSRAKYSPASMTLQNATGYFYELFMSLSASLPLTSFEGEWHDKYQSAGIISPCLSSG